MQPHQHLLGDVVGVAPIARPCQRPAVDLPVVAPHQHLERRLLTGLRALNQGGYALIYPRRLAQQNSRYPHRDLETSVVPPAFTRAGTV